MLLDTQEDPHTH